MNLANLQNNRGLLIGAVVVFLGLAMLAYGLFAKPSLTGKSTVYEQKEMGFTLSYPAKWQLNDQSSTQAVVYFISPERQERMKANPRGGGLRIFDVMVRVYNSVSDLPYNTEKKALGEWLQTQKITANDGLKSGVSFAGVSAYEWTEPKLGSRIIMFEKNNKIYRLETGEQPTSADESILDSFKITAS